MACCQHLVVSGNCVRCRDQIGLECGDPVDTDVEVAVKAWQRGNYFFRVVGVRVDANQELGAAQSRDNFCPHG